MAAQRIAVIGGGPAGLAAGIAACREGARVVLFERLPRAGKKLSVTGGGRGNVAHVGGENDFAAAFGKRGRFGVPAWRTLGGAEGLRKQLAALGVPTVVDDEGRIYPASMRAPEVADTLLAAFASAGGMLRCGTRVEALAPTDDGGWQVNNQTFAAVVLAAGGQSAAELGSDGSGFALARNVGHRIVAPVPGLAPLLLDEPWLAQNSGASVDHAVLRLRAGRRSREVRGAVLATHAGISGPAALALSGAIAREWTGQDAAAVELGLIPGGMDWSLARRENGAKSVLGLLAIQLPKGLAAGLLERCAIAPAVAVARLAAKDERRLDAALKGLPLRLRGIAPFAQSMVTCGGVDLREIHPETLESRLAPNLFFAGEVLDMDAPSGGWNLLWAFSSGALAGRSAALRLREEVPHGH